MPRALLFALCLVMAGMVVLSEPADAATRRSTRRAEAKKAEPPATTSWDVTPDDDGWFAAVSQSSDKKTTAATDDAATAEKAEQDERTLINAARMMRRAGMVQFNFTEMELPKFIRFMSELFQETIVLPPNINGKITIISPKACTLPEARRIIVSVLQTNGFSIQDMGDYSKVVQGGNSVDPNVYKGRGGPGSGEETTTYIIPLSYIVADYIVQAMQQAFGQSVMVIPLTTGRDVLLQGRSTDVNKAVEFIRELDVPATARVHRTLKLKFGDPTIIANQVNAAAQASAPLRGVVAIPDATTKQVIVIGEEKVIASASKLVADLDLDTKTGDFHIYKLKNIDATVAAEQVGKVLAAAAMLQPNKEGQFTPTVVPDLTTNSLIFAATQIQYDALKKILDEIDILPKQVLIRGFLAEVNVTNLNKAGIDWSILGGQMWDNFLLGAQGTLGESGIPEQFISWFNNLSQTQVAAQYDPVTGRITQEGYTTYRPLALAYLTIEMLKKYDAVNILSMPRLMCTDNKESSFQVGQVVPTLSGTTADTTNPSSVQNSYNYKDLGLTLTVTPHIRNDDVIAMDIEQTTEELLTAIGNVTPVTAKRQVKTSVVVKDGETIVLGGMVKEVERSLKRRVPGLSFIPLIGGLFQKVEKDREKVDFIIFLTPQIVRNAEDSRAVTEEAAMSDSTRFGVDKSELSPEELEVDRRFRELYRRSAKTQ